MKNKLQRWYEQESHLKAFMNLLEGLKPEEQCEIAVDIILFTSELSDREYSNIVNEIGEYNPREYKRWYDKNPNIHSAIESLKDLSQEKIDMVINEFSTRIIEKYENEVNE